MKRGYCLLVFGISGVGKTASCEAFIVSHPEFFYVRASALLTEALATTAETLRTGSARQIEKNQAVLGERLGRLRANQPARSVLVDVHAVIDNDVELVKIPLTTIESLEPDGLILLEAQPEIVAARRKNDLRSRPERSVNDLDRELAAERAAVTEFGAALRLPVEIADVPDGFRLDGVITRLMARVYAG